MRNWQGDHTGLSLTQASDVGLYLKGLNPHDRASFIANLAAMFAETMMDVATLAANLVPDSDVTDDAEVDVVDDDMPGSDDLRADVEVVIPEEEPEEEPGDDPTEDEDPEEEHATGGRDGDEVVMMQNLKMTNVVSQLSMQIQALLRNLNGLSTAEAHGKAGALLRRLHQRFPRAWAHERPMGVEDLEAALAAFISPAGVALECDWSINTNWANAWWEVFHSILGGDSSPSSSSRDGHPGPQVEPELMEPDGDDVEVDAALNELALAYDLEEDDVVEDCQPPLEPNCDSKEKARAAAMQDWDDWAVASELGKTSRGRLEPDLRVKRARVEVNRQGDGHRIILDIQPVPERVRPRPERVPQDPHNVWELWKQGMLTDKDVLYRFGQDTLDSWQQQLDLSWGRRRRSLVPENPEGQPEAEPTVKDFGEEAHSEQGSQSAVVRSFHNLISRIQDQVDSVQDGSADNLDLLQDDEEIAAPEGIAQMVNNQGTVDRRLLTSGNGDGQDDSDVEVEVEAKSGEKTENGSTNM